MIGHTSKVRARRQLCLDRISEIEGIEVEAPGGAFYLFARLTDEMWANNDKDFVLKLLHEEHVLVVHGSGFSPEMGAGHIRIVFLADESTLNTAFDRIQSFLQRHRLAKK
jgi:aspartate/methionine/tyrosine aminotransferase